MSIVQCYALTAREGGEPALEQALRDLGIALAGIDGSLGTTVLRARDDDRAFRFYEFWRDEKARAAAGPLLPGDVMGRIKDALGAPPQVSVFERLDA